MTNSKKPAWISNKLVSCRKQRKLTTDRSVGSGWLTTSVSKRIAPGGRAETQLESISTSRLPCRCTVTSVASSKPDENTWGAAMYAATNSVDKGRLGAVFDRM